MIKMTMKFTPPTETEKRRILEQAAKEELRKKGFPNLRVKATKKSGDQYDMEVTGDGVAELQKIAKKADERFKTIQFKELKLKI
jgi:hypothetical protein